MELSNYVEYRHIREELRNLKNCITNYIGFVMGGSGIAFIGFQYIKDDKSLHEIIGFVSLILAIILSLVLSIIFYKFNSHNRYAGYCKLLDQEQIEIEIENGDILTEQSANNILSWEICVNRLRSSDFEEEPFANLYADYNLDDVITDEGKAKIKSFSGKHKSADDGKFCGGIRILYEAFLGKLNTKSWQFPLFVVIVFLILAVIYLSLSVYYYARIYTFDFSFGDKYLSIIGYAI